MKIINPNDFEHTIEFIPRFYNFSSLLFELYDESNKVTQFDGSITFSVVNGVISWFFENDQFDWIDLTTENGTYQLKVTDGEDVVYRGKILATTQDTQSFKLTDGLYSYE